MRFFLAIITLCLALSSEAGVRVGADRLEVLLPLLEGKKVGLTGNQSSVLSDDAHTLLLDTLLKRGVTVTKLYSPEHGFRGTADAGAKVRSGIDAVTGLPVFSLYGKNRKPSPQDLSGIEVMVLDLQDVGVRFYTYISTMYYVLEACAESGIPLIVLDRPNPHDAVDGPMLDPSKRSFIGMFPIPAVHGLTMGELALMTVGEKWLKTTKTPLLTVLKCEGWKHGDPYALPVPPSPNLRSERAILLYPTLCFYEGTSWSVGRGTVRPFEEIGYPDRSLGAYRFTPQSMPGATAPMYRGKRCYGPNLSERTFAPGIDVELLVETARLSQKAGIKFFARPEHFDLLAGTSKLRRQIESGLSAGEIRASWSDGLARYRLLRSRYLLYSEPASRYSPVGSATEAECPVPESRLGARARYKKIR